VLSLLLQTDNSHNSEEEKIRPEIKQVWLVAAGGDFPDAIATLAFASATGLGRSAALSLT
jgi:hypothetical protein